MNIVEKIKQRVCCTKIPPQELKLFKEVHETVTEIERQVVGTTLEEALENGEFKGKKREELAELVESVQEVISGV